MKRYRLLRELPGIPAGAVFELEQECLGEAYFLSSYGLWTGGKFPEWFCKLGTVALSISMVEEQPEWFERCPDLDKVED